MICYEGKRTRHGVTVTRQERPDNPGVDTLQALPLRLDLADYSPTGFEWGYGGSGPAQLALALQQAFKWEVVALLPETEWQLSDANVQEAARRLTSAAKDAWD